jgi:inhibitor of KinA sporulation pathway (predicted exonuclease)
MGFAIVFDLEFTAWEGSMEHRWMRPGEFREVVQIGAVKLDAQSLGIVGEFDALVRPRLNPVLSPYLERLTGIFNRHLAERGVDFVDAYRDFISFADGACCVAFGRDDLVLEENLRLYGIGDAPVMAPYTNIVPWLYENGIDPRGCNACDVGPLTGVAFEGHKHNALDDARSVAAGIRALVQRGARNPLLL